MRTSRGWGLARQAVIAEPRGLHQLKVHRKRPVPTAINVHDHALPTRDGSFVPLAVRLRTCGTKIWSQALRHVTTSNCSRHSDDSSRFSVLEPSGASNTDTLAVRAPNPADGRLRFNAPTSPPAHGGRRDITGSAGRAAHDLGLPNSLRSGPVGRSRPIKPAISRPHG